MTETATRIETGLYSEVLFPVDFTSLGWQVLTTAERLATGFDAPLRLLHVDTASPWSDVEPSMLQLNASSLGRSVRVQIAPDRDVALGVGRVIAGRDALIVMGAHAHTGAADIFVDSNLERILRVVDAPVVVSGPRARDDDAAFSRIVLCIDADEPPVELIQDVGIWARRLSLSVDLVTVQPGGYDDRLDEMHTQERRLAALADDFSRAGIATYVVVLRGSRPAHEIVRYAAAVPGTVIALATHARIAAVRAIVGSVGMKVIRHAAGPVLLRRRDSQPRPRP